MKEVLSHKHHHYHVLGLVLFVALVSVAFAVDYTSLTGMDVATVGDPVQAGEGTVGCTAKSSKISSSIGNGMDLIKPGLSEDELRTYLNNKCTSVCTSDCKSQVYNVNHDYTYLSLDYEITKNSLGILGIIMIDATADCKCSDKPKETTPQKTVCEGLAQEIQDVNEIIRTRMGDVGGYQGHSENRRLGPIDDFTVEIYKELLKNLQEKYKLKCVKTSTQPYIDPNKFPFKEETETSSEDNYKLDWDEQEGFKYKIPLLDSTRRTPCEQRKCDYNRAYTSENDPCKGCGGCIPDHEQTQERVFPGPNPGHCSPKETWMLPRIPERLNNPPLDRTEISTTPRLFDPTGSTEPADIIIKFPLSERGKQTFEPSQDTQEKVVPSRFKLGPTKITVKEGEPVEEMAKEFEKQQKQENIIQKTWKWIKGLFGAGGVVLPEDFNDLPEPMKARIKEFFKNKETGSLIKFDASEETASQYIGDGNKVLVALNNFPVAKCANNCELQITTSEGKTISIKANINSDSGLIEIDPKDLTRIPQTTGKIEVVQQPKDSKFEITSISLVRIGGEPDEDIKNVRLYDDSKLSWSDDTEDKPTDTLISSADNIAKYKFTAEGEEVKLSFVNQGGKPYPYPPLPPRIKEIPTGITVNFPTTGNFPTGQVNLPPSVAVKENLDDISVFNLKISDPEQIKIIKIAGKEISKEDIKKTIRICIGQEISDDLSITEPVSDTLAVHENQVHMRPNSGWVDKDLLSKSQPKDGIIASGHYNTVSFAEDYPTRPPRATDSRTQPNLLTAGVVRITGKATSEGLDCESIKEQISYGKLFLGTAIARLEKIIQRLNELNKKGQGNSEEARNLINQKNDLQSKLPRLQEEITKLEQQYEKECREVKEKTTIVKIPCDVVIPEEDTDKIKDIVITREEDTTPKTPCEQRRCDPNRSYLTTDQDPCEGCYSCNPNTNTCAPPSSTLTTDEKICSKNSVPSCQGKSEGETCTTEFHTSQCELANIMIKGGRETSGCICPAPDDTEYELVCSPGQILVDLGAPGKQCVCKDPEKYLDQNQRCVSKQRYCDAYLPGSIWATGSHGSLYCKCPQGQEIINNECRGRPETGQSQQQIIDTTPKTAPTQPPATIGTPGQQTTTQPTSTTTTQPPSITTPTQTSSTTTVSPPAQQTTTPPPSISPPDQDDGMELCPPAQMCPADYYANVLMGCYESYAGVSEVCRQSIGLCSQVCNNEQAPQQQKQTTQQECDNLRCAVIGGRTAESCAVGPNQKTGYLSDCTFTCNLGSNPDYTNKVNSAIAFFNSYSSADIDRVSNDC